MPSLLLNVCCCLCIIDAIGNIEIGVLIFYFPVKERRVTLRDHFVFHCLFVCLQDCMILLLEPRNEVDSYGFDFSFWLHISPSLEH